MRRPLQVTLLVLSGLGLLHASLFTDVCLRYVKPGMRPLLIVSGFVLLVLGIAEAATRERKAEGTEAEKVKETEGHGRHGAGPHGHDHSAVPRVAWLLLLPALSLLFYAPPALGAYTASRQPAKVVAEQDDFDPLPRTSPLPITLTDFTTRVQQDRTLAIKGRTVEMSGLVTPVPGGGSWDLTRIIISCCAADAQSVKVRIYDSSVPPANTWVSVTGNWHPGGKLGTKSAPVAVDAQTVKKIQRPSNGYQDALPFPSA
ncbi:TIGR03943 family putative permease subunit [Streptomyces sp. NPDC048254]|uniref:TIGR03943 family putative permease subunit n=1 Tax=Streptomyces sp. NPDC048254 TaxID=3365525 RepID=UPI003710AD37